MKSGILTCVLIVLLNPLSAQDSTHVDGSDQMTQETMPIIGPTLSAWPTSQELADLLTSYDIDTRQALSRFAETRESALDGLVELANNLSIRGSTPVADTGSAGPNRVLVVESIKRIGTEGAFRSLAQLAANHPNEEVRGVALEAIASEYYRVATENNWTPEKAIVPVLIRALQTDQFLGYLQQRTGQIAQEGLMRWLGLDFGDPSFKSARTDPATGRESTPVDFALTWYEENKIDLTWNSKKHKFDVK